MKYKIENVQPGYVWRHYKGDLYKTESVGRWSTNDALAEELLKASRAAHDRAAKAKEDNNLMVEAHEAAVWQTMETLAEKCRFEGRLVVSYRGPKGNLCHRFADEFLDGRFELVGTGKRGPELQKVLIDEGVVLCRKCSGGGLIYDVEDEENIDCPDCGGSGRQGGYPQHQGVLDS